MFFEETYVLTNITIIDGIDNDPQSNMFLRVNGRNIEEIGSMDAYAADGRQEIDLAGHYVMPGLIDAHIHMAGGRGTGEWGDTEILCEPKEVRAMRSIYEAQKMLKAGFTTVRDISWNSLYMKRIFFDNTLPGPKVIACGPGLARAGGHCDSPQFPLDFVKQNHFWTIIADGEDECRRAVRHVLREGADQIKFWATGGGNWGTDRITDTHYSQEEMNMICKEAHMIKGTMVCAHCETEETIRMAIEAGVDTIEHGEELTPELCDLMVERDIILVPTLFLLANWYDLLPIGDIDESRLVRPDAFLYRDYYHPIPRAEQEAYMKQVIDSFELALKKGVKIALGSDTVYEPSCEYGAMSLLEFAELVKRGMTLKEAICAATYTAAKACGMQRDIGSIEEGKLADLLILKDDPTRDVEVLCNTENIRCIVTDGRLTVEEGRFAW